LYIVDKYHKSSEPVPSLSTSNNTQANGAKVLKLPYPSISRKSLTIAKRLIPVVLVFASAKPSHANSLESNKPTVSETNTGKTSNPLSNTKVPETISSSTTADTINSKPTIPKTNRGTTSKLLSNTKVSETIVASEIASQSKSRGVDSRMTATEKNSSPISVVKKDLASASGANNSSNNKNPQVPAIVAIPTGIRRRRSDNNDEIEDDIVVQKPNLKLVTSRAPEVLEKELVSIGSTGPKYKPAPKLGVDPYQNYIAARDSAIRSIGGLGADQVPHYVESVGPGNAHLVGRVNGSMSSDGTRWWRLDYSPQKGTHINWARIEKGGKLYQGSTSIGADEKIFFKLLQSHFGMLP
jgi:hypothetical protein